MIDFRILYDFLRELAANNHREWFHENKKRYDEAAKSYKKLTEYLIANTAGFDKSVAGIQARDCVFRINRDIRFSNDKSPYKLNFGGFIVPGGRKAARAGYYLHIQPGESFIAGGIYMPPPVELYQVRNLIYQNTEAFLQIINNIEFVKSFGKLDGEMLKRSPRDFPAGSPHNELLRYKSYIVMHRFDESMTYQGNFHEYVLNHYRTMYPFISFINSAF